MRQVVLLFTLLANSQSSPPTYPLDHFLHNPHPASTPGHSGHPASNPSLDPTPDLGPGQGSNPELGWARTRPGEIEPGRVYSGDFIKHPVFSQMPTYCPSSCQLAGNLPLHIAPGWYLPGSREHAPGGEVAAKGYGGGGGQAGWHPSLNPVTVRPSNTL